MEEEQLKEYLRFLELDDVEITDEILKEKYKELVLRFHPDKEGGSNEKVKSNLINFFYQ